MKKGFLSLLLVIVLASVIIAGCAAPAPTPSPSPAPAPAPAPEKTFELKMAYHFTDRSFPHQGAIMPWAQKIMDETNGRVKITVYPGGTLVGQEQEYESIETGTVDLGAFTPPAVAGRFPLTEFVTLPKMFHTGEEVGKIFNDILLKYCVNTEMKDVKLLWSFVFPPMQLISSKPVKTLADFKGTKVRTEGKVEGWVADALGAAPVFVPTPEIFNSLERNLLDVVFFSWEGMVVFKFNEIAKYRTECDMFGRGFPIAMNMKTWNSLPPDIQAVFEKNSGTSQSAMVGKANDEVQAKFKGIIAGYDKGKNNPGAYTLAKADSDAWEKAMDPIVERWAKELEGKNLPVRALLADVKSMKAQFAK